MRKLILLLIFLPSVLIAQHTDTSLKKSSQQKWIKTTLKEFKKNNTFSLFTLSEPRINSNPEFMKTSFRVQGDTKIKCLSGEWIYFRTNSSHHNKEIGDVCIAISDTGLRYIHYGHICGGLLDFISKSDQIPVDASDFFNRFNSDSNDGSWVNLNAKQ